MTNISIIIPVYNAEEYLLRCITSILNQTFKDFEVLFIDDGSTDHSVDIINQFTDNRFRLIKQSNHGQASARNRAISLADGEFITFIDADDYVDITLLEKLYTSILENQSDISWCGLARFKNDDEIVEKVDGIYEAESHKRYILNNAGPCAKLIRKSLLVDHQLYFLENHFYEDIAVVPGYALFADNISFVDEQLYFYRIHQGSTMKQKAYNEKFTDIFDSMNHLYSYFKQDYGVAYAEEIEFLFIEHLLHAASLRFLPYEKGRKNVIFIVQMVKVKFPNWMSNKYYKSRNMKFKIVCRLIYWKAFLLLRVLLK